MLSLFLIRGTCVINSPLFYEPIYMEKSCSLLEDYPHFHAVFCYPACPLKSLCCFVHWNSFFDLHHCYRILTVSHFQFTCYLQDLDCLPYSMYMLFTGPWQSPFFNLHVIYRILTVFLFQFTCYLQDLDSLPFTIYMLLTVSLFQFTCY